MAYATRNTTAQLAEFIPDITIRTHAEVEAEEAAADADRKRKVVPPLARSNNDVSVA